MRQRGRAPTTPAGRARSAAEGLLARADGGTLVGRDLELARLREAWAAAADGQAGMALVGGESGSGKTRLVAELAAEAVAGGGQVLVGRCRRTGNAPYEPLVEATAAALAARGAAWLDAHERRHGAALRRLAPGLPARATHRPAPPVWSRAQLFEGFAAALAALTETAPTLLVLEDLHWASRSAVELLGHVVTSRPAAALCVVGTYRDAIDPSHPLAGLVHGTGGAPAALHLVLEGLGPAEVATLVVERLAAAGPGGARLAGDLARATEGNPLLVLQLLALVEEAGVVDGGLLDRPALARLELPTDAAGLVAARTAGAAPEVRRVLEVAAVVGDDVTADVLAELVPASPGALERALASACRLGLLEPDGSRTGRWLLTHERFREAIHGSLAANDRVRLHDEVARLLEHRARDADPATRARLEVRLAHHFGAAAPVGDSERAFAASLGAAERAAAALAFEEAADHYGTALAMLGPAEAPSLRTDVLVDLAEAQRQGGDDTRARQTYLQAAQASAARGDGPRLARSALGMGRIENLWGPDPQLIDLLEQSLSANPDDPGLHARLLARLGEARAGLDPVASTRARCDRAWELAWDSRDPATMAAVLRCRHEALSGPDDLDDRVEAVGELLAMATNAGHVPEAIEAHAWSVADHLELGRLADVDRSREAHAGLARQLGEPRHLHDVAAWSAMRSLLDGRRDEAEALADRVLSLARDPASARTTVPYWHLQYGLALAGGSEAELDSLLEVWSDLVAAHDAAPAWRASRALLLARLGRHGEAGAELDHLASLALPRDRHWLATTADLAEVATEVGHDALRRRAARDLAPFTRRLVAVPGGWLCRTSVARVLALATGPAGAAGVDDALSAPGARVPGAG